MNEWKDDNNTKPTPSRPGVKADLYLCIDLSDQYRLFCYVYELNEWTSNGDDKQFVRYWCKLPEIPGG